MQEITSIAPRMRAHEDPTAAERRIFLYGSFTLTGLPIVFFPAYEHMTQGVGVGKTLPQILSFLLILSTMHVALSLYFYLDDEYRAFIKEHKPFYVYLPIAVIAACGSFSLVTADSGLVYLFMFYNAWLFFHYGRQNFGLFSFVCISRGDRPNKVERVAFHVAPVGALLAAYPLIPETKLATAFLGDSLYWGGLFVYAFACTATVVSAAVRHGRDTMVLAYLLLLVGFWAPTFVFSSYSPAIMGYAVAHALQYFLFMFFSASGHRQGARYGVLLLAIGAVTGWVLIWLTRERDLWGPALQFILGAELGVIMWHFMIDAGLWRLRHNWQRNRVRERFSFIFAR